MSAPICYIVDKDLDNYLASRFDGDSTNPGKSTFNAHKVASLRGLYDQKAIKEGRPVLIPEGKITGEMTFEEKEEIYRKLAEFRNELYKKTAKRVSKGTRKAAECFDLLRRAFPVEHRNARIRHISYLFSKEVDRLVREKKVGRQVLVNGFWDTSSVQKTFIGGSANILCSVYNGILEKRQQLYVASLHPHEAFKAAEASGNLDYYEAPQDEQEYAELLKHQYEEYTKILENWEQLIPFVLKDLVQKEGVKIGINKNYAVPAPTDAYNETDISEKWEISESKRDGWMENSDLQSAFGSVGQQVRRILATLPAVHAEPIFETRNGQRVYAGVEYKTIRDDIGAPKFLDPVTTHQRLMDFLRGVQDEDEMMDRLCKPRDPNPKHHQGKHEVAKAKISWMQPIVDVLNSNPQARTQFFVDFKKNFQPYSVMFEDSSSSGKLRILKTRLINKQRNILIGQYKMTMGPNGTFPANIDVWNYKPVFQEGIDGGEIDWERLVEVRSLVSTWVRETKEKKKGPGGSDVYLATASLTSRSPNTVVKIDGKDVPVTLDLKRQFLMEVFSSLGFDINLDTIDRIIFSSDIYKVRDELARLFDIEGESGIHYNLNMLGNDVPGLYGTLYTLGKSKEEKAAALSTLKEKGITFRKLYNTPKTVDGKVTYPAQEHLNNLLDVICRNQEGYRIESRARYQGNTMYSDVAPSYLGDRLEAIKNFVDKDDHNGLLKFLKEEYLCSAFFVDDGYIASNGERGEINKTGIFNSWLAEMVEACKNTAVPLKDSVAAIFSYERDLGRDDRKFEDFTSKDHALDMFIHFFADEQQKKGYGGKGNRDINKKCSAMYPVFILGDAGVSKYIRGPRISTPTRYDAKGNKLSDADANKTKEIRYEFDSEAQDKVLESFWAIYLQEKRRMEMDEAVSIQFYANGKVVDHPKGEFSILTFLNPHAKDYNEKYSIPEGQEYNKDVVKEKIREYLDDKALHGTSYKLGDSEIKVPSYKDRLEQLGVLETTTIDDGRKQRTIFAQISTCATPDNIDDKIREYYWNTKLATAQQLQLMTIDPSFYHGTKDLQKRYKEIHAPGSILSTSARDFDREYYCTYRPDGVAMERCVYFKDLRINAEETNPEFMETIVRLFAQVSDEEVEKAIREEDILHVRDNDADEYNRQKRLSELLGSNYGLYKDYTKNTLTDGQGYRTLTSYRRVMGMAGKWTKDMDDAYNKIMEIREAHAVRDGSGKIVDYTEATEDELKMIASLALVLQPIKPYMFTHEKVECEIAKRINGQIVTDAYGNPVMMKTTKLVPVQHKYAEALIIPELLPKGNKLRDLGLWMDNNHVDMVGSDKIAKVGAFGQAELGGVTDGLSLHAALDKAVIHDLPYRDYRIQTNVPEHINASQLFGTQVRKLIMAGIDLNADYFGSYLGVDEVNLTTDGGNTNTKCKLTGRNMLALFNSLICANITDSYNTFAENAEDIEELSDLLQQSTVGSMREAMDNLLSYAVTGDEKFMIPLFEGGLEHDAAALILSTFKKIVNKQQIAGGSAVQVSAFGIDGYKEDGGLRFVQDPENNKNLLYAEIEVPFDRTFMLDVTVDGKTTKQKVEIPYDKYCYSDGNVLPSTKRGPIEKYIEKDGKKVINPEWKKYQSYTYKEVDGKLVPCKYNDPEAKVYKPLIEEDYPDILSIVAYRIPTERDYSMLNCRIKKFSLKFGGGTMKVPPQGTTIAGFDFDIDKLYFMMREYHKHFVDESYDEESFDETPKYNIWARVFNDYPQIREALEAKRNEDLEKHPEKIKKIPVIGRNGVPTGRYKRERPALNSYWKEANIEERFGKNKRRAFAEAAVKEGYAPNVKRVEGAKTEWFEEYDFSLPPEKNTRAARNNLLISIIQARLEDPATAQQRYTPGGFAKASAAALRMRVLQFAPADEITDASGNVSDKLVDEYIAKIKDDEDPLQDPEPNYDPTDPYTMLVYNQQNQIAGKLIGIFANQNANHAFSSLMDTFELYDPIEFCGNSFQDLLHKGNPAKASEVDLAMAELLAASVDAVKDPVLNFLNLNTITADAGALLVRLGYSAEDIGLLFNQPIIKAVCEDALTRGVNVTTAIAKARRDLKDYLTGEEVGNRTHTLSKEELANGIVNERRIAERADNAKEAYKEFYSKNAKFQSDVLDLFSSILSTADDVSKFVLNTKFTASNAVSSTLGGFYAQQMRVREYLEKYPSNPEDEKDRGDLSYRIVVSKYARGAGVQSKPIDDRMDYLDMSQEEYLHNIRFNPFAFEQAMFDANRKALRLLTKYFPYDNDIYVDARNYLNNLCMYGSLTEDEINEIHRNIPVALLAKQVGTDFDGEAKHGDTGMSNRQYYREKFAEDLKDLLNKYPHLHDLALFRYLYPDSRFVDDHIDPATRELKTREIWRISMQDVGGMGPDVKEEIRESWASLMTSDDDGEFDNQDLARLGQDLFMYCFYQLGFNYSPLSFMHLAPTAVKDAIKVPRKQSLSMKSFEPSRIDGENVKDNDVLVWRASETGSEERARDYFDGVASEENVLIGRSLLLPDKLNYNSLRSLVVIARSRPEFNFFVDIEFSQEEFDKLAHDNLDEDIPENIYFTKDTLKNRGKENISYGKARTYRTFLNDILSGKEANLNPEEFAQMYILNHLDDSRFVLDTARENKDFRDILDKELKKSGNSQMDGFEYRDRILIDVSSYDSREDRETLKKLVRHETDGNGKLISSTWCPFIKIGTSYYMAESGNPEGAAFNVNSSYSIYYRKVVPWGSATTITYDETPKYKHTLAPALCYKSSIDAAFSDKEKKEPLTPPEAPPETPVSNGTSPEPLVEQPKLGELPSSRMDLTKMLYDAYLEAHRNTYGEDLVMEDKIEVMRDIGKNRVEDLVETAKYILEERRKSKTGRVAFKLDAEGKATKEIVALDSAGNPTTVC